ncbi:MAG TPA: hypothetical protein VJ838_06675 [Gaiellaceae bacterium]|nr:hypothetical protein [Gaiellaceae bacterium]
MSPREQRAIRNEELFREVNLRIAELQEGSHDLTVDGLLPLVCECVHTGCTTPLEVDPTTFEQVHENPRRFIVAPGHEDLDAETVVERRDNYLIVEKHIA